MRFHLAKWQLQVQLLALLPLLLLLLRLLLLLLLLVLLIALQQLQRFHDGSICRLHPAVPFTRHRDKARQGVTRGA